MLEVQGLSAGYGHIQALDGVALQVQEGEVVAIIGANGAGKTTLLRTIGGALTPTAGKVGFAGKDITRIAPHQIVSLGIAQVPEGRQIFPSLTVHENLEMGAYSRHGRRQRREVEEDFAFVFELFPVLRQRVAQTAGTLSGGEQQMLAIGRALMARPRLLLLDEPSMGLAPVLVHHIFTILKQLNERGLTMLLVEQNARAALQVAHRGYVLATGRVILSGPSRILADDPRVQEIYLGKHTRRPR